MEHFEELRLISPLKSFFPHYFDLFDVYRLMDPVNLVPTANVESFEWQNEMGDENFQNIPKGTTIATYSTQNGQKVEVSLNGESALNDTLTSDHMHILFPKPKHLLFPGKPMFWLMEYMQNFRSVAQRLPRLQVNDELGHHAGDFLLIDCFFIRAALSIDVTSYIKEWRMERITISQLSQKSDEEINQSFDQIVTALSEKFDARLRS